MGSHSNMDDMSDGDAITGEQGPVDADADEYEYDGGVGGVRTGIRRNRAHKNGLPAPLQAGLQRLGELPGTTVPGFGEGRVFSNSVEFLRAWSAYEAATFTKFTSRGSCLVATHNKNWREKCAKGGVAEDSDECKSGIVPDHMGHAMIVRRCKHGVYVQSRATGVREVQTSQYLACDARLTVTATKDSKGRWMFVTRDEYHHHNHPCDQSMLDANGKSALLAHPKVMEEVERMVQARAPSRNICDMLAANFNIHVTPKELANIKRDRLGGQGAMANLKLLLARFASFPESQCVLLDDQEGQVCGVVMQSASQKKLFQRFGDNIILDWTHNTNNLGFYLGSLMVTSVSGRGVSVYDFLCLEQTETMMTTLFQAFIDGNPGAKDKVKSFVIDKDYREWRVLERMFEKSTVLLCQFHAIKWFAYVVTMRKYNLSVSARERVLKILFSMVYAQTIVDFEMHESDLEELLADESPQFIKYMQSRWYNCRKMWSDCERSLCFTALNTTSNRIESSWNQIKIILGKKLRVDLCIESIFAYMTAVLKREYRVINKYARRLVLRSSVHEYMRSTCAEISEYASDKVHQQWSVCAQHDVGSSDPYSCQQTPQNQARYWVARRSPESRTYTVDAEAWTCSCEFQVTSALPCRHLMHVSKNQLGCVQYPSETVPSRWRMSAHFDLLPLLKANARDLQTLRTGLLLSHAAFSMLVQKDYADPSTYVEPSSRRVTYIRLTRKTVQDIVVLNNLEKRNVVESQFSAMMKFMMSKSTPAFLGLAKELDALLEAKLAEWRGRQLNVKLDMKSGEEKDASDDVDDIDGDDGDDDAAIAHAIDTEESGFYDADESTLRTKPFGLTQHQATLAQVSTNHGAGAQGKPGAGAGGEPAPTAVEELGNEETPEQHDPLHDSSLTPEHNGTLHESSLTRSSTSSLVHTGAREPVRGELQFPGHASLNSYQPSELDLMLYSFDDDDSDFNFDVSTNLNEELLIPRLELENPPLVSQIMRTVADKELNPQPQVVPASVARGSVSSLSASSLTTRAVSDIVRVVVESQFPLRPVPAVASMSTADIASFMTSGVRAPRNLQQSRTRVLEPVLRGPKAKRKTNSMNALRELAESDDEIGRKVQLRTLPQSIGQGQTKKMKTTKVTGDRLGIVDETCDFPYQVREFTTALAHTTSIKDIPEKMEALPVRLTERHLSFKTPVVSTGTTTRVLNYSIPSDMLMKMCLAVKARRTSDEVVRSAQARGLSRERGVDVDLTESEVTSHGYIVSIASSLKGFSEAQISDLNAFALLRVKCASYMHDMYWLQKEFKESMGFRIPYLLRTLAERADIEEDPDLKARFKSDINFGAREQARQVLETCTLSTSFHIASPHRHLQSTISIREIVGYLCRDAKLNDSTLTYAIRQMATDYEDVHVFDCQFTNECIPKTNLAGFRWVFFPVNIAEKHWCLLSVEVEPSSIRRVVLYDPLQDAGFEDLTQRKWHEKCEAMMLRWVERDQSEVYDVRALSKPECLRIAPQDDGTSCGVFCAAMAQELMSHSTFFQDIGEISKTAIVQTRVCICWRILCGSVRQDHRELEESAQEVCARVTSGGPYASKKTGYTILSKKKTKATTRA